MPREWFPKRTIGSLPGHIARRFPSREALLFKGRRRTFAEIAANVDRVAAGLIRLGVRPGDKVALWMMNRPEWIEAAFAVMKIGAVLVPVNTRLRAEDVRYIVGQSNTSTLIVNARSGPVDYLAMVRELLPALGKTAATAHTDARLPDLRRVVLLGDEPAGGTVSWRELTADTGALDATLRERAAAVDPDSLAFLMYTSGTTGFPKGVMHDHAMIRNVVDRANRMAITESDVILMYLPLYHLFGYADGMLMSFVTGARQVLTDSFDARDCLALLAAERATIVHGFDTHFKDLIDAHERAPADVSSVRTGICAAGMASSTPIARAARALFGPLVSGYGMSEFGVGASISFLDSTEEQCVEASGYPAPGYEIRVIDPDTGRDQPSATPGEILIRGYTVMRGYYEKPKETADTIDADGFMHTGDMGLLREDGHLRFMGRYKDMLKIGGENVDPMEVEGYLLAHPAVNQVAVVGLADARLSEVAVAFVKREPDRERTADGPELSEADVIQYCRGKIASFKIPRHVVFVDEFPMTGSGKIQKVKLRAEAASRLGSA